MPIAAPTAPPVSGAPGKAAPPGQGSAQPVAATAQPAAAPAPAAPAPASQPSATAGNVASTPQPAVAAPANPSAAPPSPLPPTAGAQDVGECTVEYKVDASLPFYESVRPSCGPCSDTMPFSGYVEQSGSVAVGNPPRVGASQDFGGEPCPLPCVGDITPEAATDGTTHHAGGQDWSVDGDTSDPTDPFVNASANACAPLPCIGQPTAGAGTWGRKAWAGSEAPEQQVHSSADASAPADPKAAADWQTPVCTLRDACGTWPEPGIDIPEEVGPLADSTCYDVCRALESQEILAGSCSWPPPCSFHTGSAEYEARRVHVENGPSVWSGDAKSAGMAWVTADASQPLDPSLDARDENCGFALPCVEWQHVHAEDRQADVYARSNADDEQRWATANAQDPADAWTDGRLWTDPRNCNIPCGPTGVDWWAGDRRADAAVGDYGRVGSDPDDMANAGADASTLTQPQAEAAFDPLAAPSCPKPPPCPAQVRQASESIPPATTLADETYRVIETACDNVECLEGPDGAIEANRQGAYAQFEDAQAWGDVTAPGDPSVTGTHTPCDDVDCMGRPTTVATYEDRKADVWSDDDVYNYNIPTRANADASALADPRTDGFVDPPCDIGYCSNGQYVVWDADRDGAYAGTRDGWSGWDDVGAWANVDTSNPRPQVDAGAERANRCGPEPCGFHDTQVDTDGESIDVYHDDTWWAPNDNSGDDEWVTFDARNPRDTEWHIEEESCVETPACYGQPTVSSSHDRDRTTFGSDDGSVDYDKHWAEVDHTKANPDFDVGASSCEPVYCFQPYANAYKEGRYVEARAGDQDRPGWWETPSRTSVDADKPLDPRHEAELESCLWDYCTGYVGADWEADRDGVQLDNRGDEPGYTWVEDYDSHTTRVDTTKPARPTVYADDKFSTWCLPAPPPCLGHRDGRVTTDGETLEARSKERPDWWNEQEESDEDEWAAFDPRHPRDTEWHVEDEPCATPTCYDQPTVTSDHDRDRTTLTSDDAGVEDDEHWGDIDHSKPNADLDAGASSCEPVFCYEEPKARASKDDRVVYASAGDEARSGSNWWQEPSWAQGDLSDASDPRLEGETDSCLWTYCTGYVGNEWDASRDGARYDNRPEGWWGPVYQDAPQQETGVDTTDPTNPRPYADHDYSTWCTYYPPPCTGHRDVHLDNANDEVHARSKERYWWSVEEPDSERDEWVTADPSDPTNPDVDGGFWEDAPPECEAPCTGTPKVWGGKEDYWGEGHADDNWTTVDASDPMDPDLDWGGDFTPCQEAPCVGQPRITTEGNPEDWTVYANNEEVAKTDIRDPAHHFFGVDTDPVLCQPVPCPQTPEPSAALDGRDKRRVDFDGPNPQGSGSVRDLNNPDYGGTADLTQCLPIPCLQGYTILAELTGTGFLGGQVLDVTLGPDTTTVDAEDINDIRIDGGWRAPACVAIPCGISGDMAFFTLEGTTAEFKVREHEVTFDREDLRTLTYTPSFDDAAAVIRCIPDPCVQAGDCGPDCPDPYPRLGFCIPLYPDQKVAWAIAYLNYLADYLEDNFEDPYDPLAGLAMPVGTPALPTIPPAPYIPPLPQPW